MSAVIQVNNGRHLMYLEVFPIGLDVEHFQVARKSLKFQLKVDELEQTFASNRIIIGIDRVDYIKGISHKLLAFEQLLRCHPEYIQQRLILIQIGIHYVIQWNIAASPHEV